MTHRRYVDGRLLLAGLRPGSLSMRERCDATEAVWLDMVTSGLEVDKALDALDRHADEAIATAETWGMSDAAQADQAAMMEQWGPRNDGEKSEPAQPPT